MTGTSYTASFGYELALVIVVIVAAAAGFHADSIVAGLMDVLDFG